MKYLFVLLALLFPLTAWGQGTANLPLSGGPITSFSKYIENPVAETFETVHHFKYATVATSIHCQCRGTGSPTATMEWQNDTVSVDAGTIICDAEEQDLILTGDTTFDVGSDLDLVISAIGGTTVTDCTFIIYF